MNNAYYSDRFTRYCPSPPLPFSVTPLHHVVATFSTEMHRSCNELHRRVKELHPQELHSHGIWSYDERSCKGAAFHHGIPAQRRQNARKIAHKRSNELQNGLNGVYMLFIFIFPLLLYHNF